MKLRGTVLGLVGLAGAAAQAQQICPAPAPGVQVLQHGPVQLQWRAHSAIAVGKPFALDVLVCPAAAELLRVEASMPEHRHGMNYRPSLVPQGPGRWRAEGLLWHMAGRWELRLDVKHAGQDLHVRQSVTLP
jgi:hypothetical protein